MQRLFLILFFYCSGLFHGLAQQPIVKFETLKIHNGPRTGLKRIFQDSRGYIWFGTWHNLGRFDGYRIRYYTQEELSNDQFQSTAAKLVFEDRKKHLWIATDAGALMMYNRDRDRFETVNDSTRSLKAPASSFAEDENGNFWISTSGGGLFYYQVQTGALKNYRNISGDPTSITGNDITKIVFDDDHVLWVGTTKGLCRYDPAKDRFIRHKLANKDPNDTYRFESINSLHVSREGKLFIGSTQGVHIFNCRTFEDQHLLSDPGNPESISHNFITDIKEDEHGKIWIATYGGGLNRYDPPAGKFERWLMNARDPGSLSGNNIAGLYFDRDKNLWIAVADKGIMLYNPNAGKIHTIANKPDDPQSISGGSIYKLFMENDSIIWAGINGGGLNRVNIYTGRSKKYLHDPTDKTSLGHNTTEAIDIDRNGNIWVGPYGAGINMLDKKSDTFIRYTHSSVKNSISNDETGSIFIDEHNMMWTINSLGLDVFDINRKKFRHFSDDSLKRSIGIPLSGTWVTGRGGNVWFVSSSGMVVFDRHKKQFANVSSSFYNADSARIICGCFRGNDILTLDSRNRIKRFRYHSPGHIEEKALYTMSGDEHILGMTADHKGNVWMISAKKLLCVNPEQGIQKDYLCFNDLPNEPIYPELFSDAKGRIFFSLFDEIGWFHPNEIMDEQIPERIEFTDFKVFNNNVQIMDSGTPDKNEFHLPKHISELSALELSYRESFFSFEFSALHYLSPEKVQYAYKMEGFNKDWVYVGNQRYASYTSLDPGEYVFKVKAGNSQGAWNEQVASIRVIVHPPFWKTWWFMFTEVIFVLALAWGILRYRIAQSVKLERLRNKIATDLHDEVGSSLTRMSIYSNILVSGMDQKDSHKYLQHISNLSREIISTMSDIVWSVDNHDDSLGELIFRMKTFARDTLNAKNINFSFSVSGLDERKKLDPVLKQNLYLIFKESVNNIVKHAEADKVQIHFIRGGNNFIMEITDNGKGIDNNRDEKGNGLRNMSRRSATINAALKIQSSSRGTTIYLNCKDEIATPFLWTWIFKNKILSLFSKISGKLKSMMESNGSDHSNEYGLLKRISNKISILMGQDILPPHAKRRKRI